MPSWECLTPGFSVDGIPISNRSSRIRMLLIGLHAVEGLQHGLHQLSLGGEQLLQVSVVVVVAGLAVALAIPGVHHLMVLGKREE
jgi:hypothetical protein